MFVLLHWIKICKRQSNYISMGRDSCRYRCWNNSDSWEKSSI